MAVVLPLAAWDGEVDPQKPWVRSGRFPHCCPAHPESRGGFEPGADPGHVSLALGLALDALTFLRNVKEGVSFHMCQNGAR